MLLQRTHPSHIVKLEDGFVYPSDTTPSFAVIDGSGCDGGIAWNRYNSSAAIGGSNSDSNNNILLDLSLLNDWTHLESGVQNISTLNYSNNNNNNNNNSNGIGTSNNTNNNAVLANVDGNHNCNTSDTSPSSFEPNIPVFLAAARAEKQQQQIQQNHHRQYHHHHHHHQQQQQQSHHQQQQHPNQQHRYQQRQQHQPTIYHPSFSTPEYSKTVTTTITNGSFTAMSAAHRTSAASKRKQLSSKPTAQSSPLVPKASSPSLASTSSQMRLPSISSSTLSSPPSSTSVLPPTPSSFTETSYSTSDDKLFLVSNFNTHDSDSILSSSIINHSDINPKGSSNMISVINCYNAESDTSVDENDDNHNTPFFEHPDNNCNSTLLSPQRPLPDIWTSFAHLSPHESVACMDSISDHPMDMTDIDEEGSDHLMFETFQEVQFSPISHDLLNMFGDQTMESSCSDEDGSNDGGYSSDHTTTQSSPTSVASSTDWPDSFEKKLPVFEEIQVVAPESEKRPRKRSTPSPGQKRKLTDSPPTHDKERKKPGRKPGQVSNVLHLWEFMRDLLLDPSISDGIIQWVSKADGVFRVVNSSEVARLWGQKKNNKKEMTYEKLSRSLRYSRLEGYFDNLPKDKNYPKKLCFKFGPKSRHFSTLEGSSAMPIL